MSSNYSIKYLKKIYSYKDTQGHKNAIVDQNGKRITNYKNFIQIINSIAYHLNNLNLKNSDVIAVELGRNMEHTACRLACYFIGLTYVSMNPDHPASRKKAIYDEVNPKLIVTKEYFNNIKIDDYDCQINESITDEMQGHIIYTSGTTGKPKGIIHNRTLFQLAEEMNESLYKKKYRYRDGEYERFNHAAFSDMMFIGALADISFLCFGDTINLIDVMKFKDPRLIKEYFIQNNITTTIMSPSLLYMMLPLPSLKFALITGESSSYSFENANCDVINVYGTSESHFVSFGNAKINNYVGKTFGNSKIYLDKSPKGLVQFEGPGIMIKYLSDKKLTDKVLAINKETNVKTLNTMDVGKYMKDGSICLLGRSDSVVNIRGKRVALGEVEYWLSQAPGVNEAAVASFLDYNNRPIICGYYQTYDYRPIEHEQIIAYLSQKISDYMIPKYLIFVKMFARNQNGKIDRSKLEKPSISSYQNNYVAPTTKTEKDVIKILESIFNFSPIGVDDNITYLGGDSLTFIELVANFDMLDIDASNIKLEELTTARLIAEFIDENKN